MEKLSPTKNQHYVPRLLLRKFSSEPVPEKDRRSISLYVLKHARRVPAGSIANECSDDYFYGTDGNLETALGDEEAKFGSLIRDLTPEALENLTDEQLHLLRMFVHWQRVRTQGMVNQLNNQASTLLKAMVSENLAREADPKYTQKDLDLVKVELTGPQVLAFSSAAKALPLIYDMEVKFILAPSTAEFVICDHPAVSCNQFIENDPHLNQRNGWTGLAVKGLQLFLPLSPEVTLALYDPTTYEYGSPKRCVCRANVKDVALLNKLQAITAVDKIYFRDSFPSDILEGLRRERESQRPIREIDVRFGETITRIDGKESQVMSLSGVNLRLGKKFHFVRQRATESYRNYSGINLPIRNEDTYALYKEFSKYIDQKVGEKRQQREGEPGSDSGNNPSSAGLQPVG